jgi:uncharacterized protein
VIIADTSGLLALFNSVDAAHERVERFVDAIDESLVVSPYVVAELDYLLESREGVGTELAVLRELAGGAYDLPAFDGEDLARAAGVIDRYRDQSIGVADASIVVLADRYRTREILTLDHRHFDVVRPLSGGRFKLIP